MADASERTGEHLAGNSHSHGVTHESRFPSSTRSHEEDLNEGKVYDSFSEFVSQHPITTLVAGFGVGVGLGVLAVAILKREERHPWTDRLSLPSLHELSSGIRKLPEKAAEYIPESLSWR